MSSALHVLKDASGSFNTAGEWISGRLPTNDASPAETVTSAQNHTVDNPSLMRRGTLAFGAAEARRNSILRHAQP